MGWGTSLWMNWKQKKRRDRSHAKSSPFRELLQILFYGNSALPETLEAPVERGQAVGKVSVYQGENLLSEYEVRAAVDAAKLTLPDALYLLWESLTVVF